MLTSGHSAVDSRIFYKEAMSLRKIYDDVVVIGHYDEGICCKDGIKIRGYKSGKSLKERYNFLNKLIDIAVEEKADVYHFHDFELVLRIMKIKKKLPNAKLIYDVHEYYPEMVTMSKNIPSILKPFGAFYVKHKEDKVAKNMDYIITTDDYNKERFSKINKNVEVVYNFSDFKLKEEPDKELSKEYDVIYQGGISVERGAINLVKAIHIASKKIKNIKMIFVGSFDDEETQNSISLYISQNGLEDNIKYLGRVSHIEVEDYIRKSKIGMVAFLPYPRYAKNIPIKQFEYMSCGVPVIGSEMPSVKRFITAYNSGLTVDSSSPEEIAKAIVKLLENPDLCSELGQNGIKAVKEEYNWGNMEERLQNIYKSLSI
jgi:glycosyltransferase involved in cell wall biosynthesis